MGRTITVSDQVYHALQRQAARSHEPPDMLAETWLRQLLDIERYPELEWRQGPGGWRTGIKGTVIDVPTVIAYSEAGYTLDEIAGDLLPTLSPDQVRAALAYYADYPDEIDRVLAESRPEAAQARLYRALGPDAYRRLTGLADPPRAIGEARERYSPDTQSPDDVD